MKRCTQGLERNPVSVLKFRKYLRYYSLFIYTLLEFTGAWSSSSHCFRRIETANESGGRGGGQGQARGKRSSCSPTAGTTLSEGGHGTPTASQPTLCRHSSCGCSLRHIRLNHLAKGHTAPTTGAGQNTVSTKSGIAFPNPESSKMGSIMCRGIGLR